MEVTRQSPVSGKIVTLDLPITQEQVDAWQAGEYIQVAFSNLTDDSANLL